MRESKITRETNETDIEIKPSLEGSGNTDITTGMAFFDHMLNSLAKHGSFDLFIRVHGDLSVDDHHTVEDAGITLEARSQKPWMVREASSAPVRRKSPTDGALA